MAGADFHSFEPYSSDYSPAWAARKSTVFDQQARDKRAEVPRGAAPPADEPASAHLAEIEIALLQIAAVEAADAFGRQLESIPVADLEGAVLRALGQMLAALAGVFGCLDQAQADAASQAFQIRLEQIVERRTVALFVDLPCAGGLQ